MATFALKAELNFLRVLDIVHNVRHPHFLSSFSRPPYQSIRNRNKSSISWHPQIYSWTTWGIQNGSEAEISWHLVKEGFNENYHGIYVQINTHDLPGIPVRKKSLRLAIRVKGHWCSKRCRSM